MPKNPREFAELFGARIVGEVPDVGGGPFGMARLAHLMHQRLAVLQLLVHRRRVRVVLTDQVHADPELSEPRIIERPKPGCARGGIHERHAQSAGRRNSARRRDGFWTAFAFVPRATPSRTDREPLRTGR